MSHLSLFDGPEVDVPQILSFVDYVSTQRKSTSHIQAQIRLRQKNRSCPKCNRVTVDPVEMHDGQIGRNGAIIPLSNTVIGFSCYSCGNEWSPS